MSNHDRAEGNHIEKENVRPEVVVSDGAVSEVPGDTRPQLILFCSITSTLTTRRNPKSRVRTEEEVPPNKPFRNYIPLPKLIAMCRHLPRK
jgi:hypothetical protein